MSLRVFSPFVWLQGFTQLKVAEGDLEFLSQLCPLTHTPALPLSFLTTTPLNLSGALAAAAAGSLESVTRELFSGSIILKYLHHFLFFCVEICAAVEMGVSTTHVG